MATIFSATEPDEGVGRRGARRGVDLDKIERGVRLILEGVGEDRRAPGLQSTPRRVAEMYAELTAGMREDPSRARPASARRPHDEMVIVKDIHFASLCEHHLAPFVGKCHIAYIPKERAHRRSVEAGATRRDLRAPLAGAGASDVRDCRHALRRPEARRRDGRDGGRAHLHDHARREEAGRRHHHLGHPRRLPQRPAHARRGDGVDSTKASDK